MAEATNPIPTASNPRVGEFDYPEVDPRLETAARALAAFKIASADPTGANLPTDIWHQAVPEAWAALASAPSPEAGAGGDLGREQIAAALFEHDERLREPSDPVSWQQWLDHAERVPSRKARVEIEAYRSRADLILGLVEETRSGKLVASTGSEDETKGAGRNRIGLTGISADTESKRTLKLHFDHEVRDADRQAILDAFNALKRARRAETPEATPKSSPDQTPVDPQMTVEEARGVLAGIDLISDQTPEDRVMWLRITAGSHSNFETSTARAAMCKEADRIELALRTLQAGGEVR